LSTQNFSLGVRLKDKVESKIKSRNHN
jgi:hypothetical protein